jgi:type IV pilus assembly protein PilC
MRIHSFKSNDPFPKKNFIFSKFNKKISTINIILFLRQLATLITSGIPLVQGCEILQQSQKNNALQTLIIAIKADIEAGKALARTLRKFPHYFDGLTCHLISIGEETGTLAVMFTRIALYKEKVFAIKKKFKQALFYPALVIILALSISLVMLIFVVPRFAELFQNIPGSLPLFTQGVIQLSRFIRDYSWLGLFLLIGLGVLSYYYNHAVKPQPAMKDWIFKLPYIGQIFIKIALIRFIRSLATTFAAGAPLKESLKTIAFVCGYHSYTKAILKLQTEISQGQQLHYAMQKNSLFPNMLIQMVKVGEESGRLDYMLEKIAEIYEAEVDYRVTNLSHLLEPLIMIILGVLIGGLVIAMYLPIFKLGTVL